MDPITDPSHLPNTLPAGQSGEGQLVAAEVVAPRKTNPPPAIIEVDPAIGRLLNNRLLVVGLLAVTGPVGLPALWFSRRFSRPTKVITTVLLFGVSVVFPLLMAFYWLNVALRPLVDAFSQARL